MTVLTYQSKDLFESAAARAHRADIGTTAIWHFVGSGSRVLFVHGFRGDHHGLQAIVGALPDYQCVVPDLPGFGASVALQSHDLQSYGKWLVDLVAETGPFDAIVGHSFGTLVVANALSQGLKQETVVLINPITTRASGVKSIANRGAELYYRLGMNSLFGNWLLSSGLVTRAMSIALTKSLQPSIRRFAHDQHAKYFSGFHSQKSVVEGFHAANTACVTDFEAHLPDRTLMISGDSDVVAPLPATVQLVAKNPNWKLVTLNKVGHLTHYEKPADVARAISNFIESHD